MNSRSELLEHIFNLAFDAPPEQRQTLIERECGGDLELQSQVEQMLAGAHDDRFLADPSLENTIQSFGHAIDQPGSTVGPYKLIQQIGEGGFGVVYAAEQDRPVRRKVAIKIIKLGMDTRQVVARFEQERQALALMDHPNIARVFDAGTTQAGRPFFVMELCAGESITHFCDSHRLTIAQRLELFVQVCNAVQHAHQKGLIHRDLKPSNILVSKADGQPQAKIIDFGIAKATQQTLIDQTLVTEQHQLIGTLEYMSPEQAQGSPDIDTRADVYSLGVLLYALLTGTTPFESRTLRNSEHAEIQRIIREVDPPKPSMRLAKANQHIASVAATRDIEPTRLGTLIRGELDWIVMKALEKDRQRRYQSASALAMDVERYLVGDAVTAAPVSRVYQFRKFARRNRSGVVGTGAVFMALAAGAAGFAWQAREARFERNRAESERDKAIVMANFLSTTLSGVSPAIARGRDATMLREMMDASARRIANGELNQSPEGEIRLRVQIGSVYRELLLLPESASMLEPALDLARATFPQDHLTLADTILHLGYLRRDQQQPSSAQAFFEEALAMARRLSPGDHPIAAMSLNSLGLLRKDANDLEGAERLYRESLDMWKRMVPHDDPNIGLLEANLGALMWSRRQLDQAEQHLHAAIDIYRGLYGEHPVLAGCLARLASIQQLRNNLDQAEELGSESLEMRRRLFGHDNHRDVADSLVQVATVLLAKGDYARAEPMFIDALSAFRNSMRGDSPLLVNTMINLSTALFFNARFTEARETAQNALAMQRRLTPQDGEPAAKLLINLANYARMSGDLAIARTSAEQAVNIMATRASGDHPALAEAIYALAWVALDEGSIHEAQSRFEASMQMLNRLSPKGHPLHAAAQAELAFLRMKTGDPETAEPMAREALEMIIRLSGPNHRHAGGVRLRLGLILLNLSRLDEAEVELQAAYDVLSAVPGIHPGRLRECVQAMVHLLTRRNELEPNKGHDSAAASWQIKLQALTPTHH